MPADKVAMFVARTIPVVSELWPLQSQSQCAAQPSSFDWFRVNGRSLWIGAPSGPSCSSAVQLQGPIEAILHPSRQVASLFSEEHGAEPVPCSLTPNVLHHPADPDTRHYQIRYRDHTIDIRYTHQARLSSTDLPYVDRVAILEEIMRLDSVWPLLTDSVPLPLPEAVARLEVLTRWWILRNKKQPRPVDLTNLTERLFPSEAGFSATFRARTQLVLVRLEFRRRHGSLDDLQQPLTPEFLTAESHPGAAYLATLVKPLGLSLQAFLTALGLNMGVVTEPMQRGFCLPIERLVPIANALELKDASPLVYCVYHLFLAPYFQVKIKGNTVHLYIKTPVHSMALLRRYGFGGLLRAHRTVRAQYLTSIGKDPAFPLGHEPETLNDLELNRRLPHSFQTVLRLVDYFKMGAEGLLAVLPDLPCFIPIHDHKGKLLEPPQHRSFKVAGYHPVIFKESDSRTAPTMQGAGKPRRPGSLSWLVTFERSFRSMTVSAFADCIGHADSALQHLESEKGRPSLGLLTSLSSERALHIPLERLAALVNQLPPQQGILPKWSTFRAQRPCLLTDKDPTSPGNSSSHGDFYKLRLYEAHYRTGKKLPSLGEIFLFLRKDLERLQQDQNLTLTREELSGILQVRRKDISNFELNRRPPSARVLQKYVDYFGVTPASLIRAIQETEFPTGTPLPDYSGIQPPENILVRYSF